MRPLPLIAALLAACCAPACRAPGPRAPGAFTRDLAFLERHVDVVVLGVDPDGPRVVVVPTWQGRVMTSTPGGESTSSYGWIGRELVASGQMRAHINAFGGEDRLWLGPEGGQYSIFFPPGAAFDLESWQTPACLDSEPWEVIDRSPVDVVLRHRARLVNWSGHELAFELQRSVELLSRERTERCLGVRPDPALRMVAFESVNRLVNISPGHWTRAKGLLSLWILGMFHPGARTTVVIPYRRGPVDELGPVVLDAYFGAVPKERLVVGREAIFFRGDGRQRGKIGVGPQRALGVLGSWDPAAGHLTIVQYSEAHGAEDYVSSLWEIQEDPYGGDVVNSYNDGPPAPGAAQLGPFYELETSSPAAALAPGASIVHTHRTIHLEGPPAALDEIARALLGVGLDRIEAALDG